MRTCLTLSIICLALSSLSAADWAGWRGPGREGISAETGLLASWPSDGPKLLWKSEKAGLGYAGMAIVGGITYTMGARGEEEFLIALDDKGAEKYATRIGPVLDWKENAWSRGPNATPIVDGDLIFALSSKGVLLCASKTDGKAIWTLDLPKDLGGVVNDVGGGFKDLGWGYSWSPLVDGDMLYITPGGPKGLFAGLEKKTGKVVWQSKGITEASTYVSPVLATIAGTKQVITLYQKGICAAAARDGELLWKVERETEYPDVVCPSPIVKEDFVYVSVGYAVGNELLKITGTGGKFKADKVYEQKVIGNKQSGVTRVGSHVFGFHEDRNWACIEFETGELLWPKSRGKQNLKAGGFVVADGRLYIADEVGTIGMIEASPKGYKEISTFKLPEESKNRKPSVKLYAYPALSDGKLYIRDQDLIFCYAVK